MKGISELKGSIFGVPSGEDFVEQLFLHLLAHGEGKPPEYLARINVLLPNRRMQRRLKGLLQRSGNLLLPRIGLVTDVSQLLIDGSFSRAKSKIDVLLDLKIVIEKLVDQDPRLSHSDVISLTTSLTSLLEEMYVEGVKFSAFENLVPEEHSGHWQRTLTFLHAIRDYVDLLETEGVTAEAQNRAHVLALGHQWQEVPPEMPVIVAGSTGSRGTTKLLMRSVVAVSNGEIILPGFDPDLKEESWKQLGRSRDFEDHPQHRFASFLEDIKATHEVVKILGTAPNGNRNRLVSLALQPAPVTDTWLSEGPKLKNLVSATEKLSLLEARDNKSEAVSIAIAVRSELEAKRSVALIAPNATLARRVTAELSRWNIIPDDSGGTPLTFSRSGRFLRLTAELAGDDLTPLKLISLLKHPLTHAQFDRGEFMRTVQEFELFLRKKRVSKVDLSVIETFKVSANPPEAWVLWLCGAIKLVLQESGATLADALRRHIELMHAFLNVDDLAKALNGEDGERAIEILDDFASPNAATAHFTFDEYLQLLNRALASESVRLQVGVRPDVMIWGTLEARVQGADTVILGGLNEGVWPEHPSADPWLSRAMRRELGLLLPERQIGLAAHDFQQAICAPSVILSRAARSDGTETVPSRWLSRLLNLLNGLEKTGGTQALSAMRARGDIYLTAADKLDRPENEEQPELRPAPAPPTVLRPRSFSVTEIEKLIRDPYAVYARRILRLSQLEPLSPMVDARLKGTVVHRVLEEFFKPNHPFGEFQTERMRLDQILQNVFGKVPDALASAEWQGQIRDNLPWLYETELKRRANGKPIANEVMGQVTLSSGGFVLRGKADRIDRTEDDALIIYDYKTGQPPSPKDIRHFDRQLVLEAVMAESGAFENVQAGTVCKVVHLGVGRTPKEHVTDLKDENEVALNREKLLTLLEHYQKADTGYPSRRAMEQKRFSGDYDHLARYGEWDASKDATRLDVN
ncbi:MAG: double-strand break repair protein AddB [Pseudomonadota bacterium]